MYQEAPSAASAWGFSAFELIEDEVDVWEDCWNSFEVFEALRTQWRVGMGGAYGLDYSVIKDVMEFYGIEEDHPQIFADLRVMESEALTIMSEDRQK